MIWARLSINFYVQSDPFSTVSRIYTYYVEEGDQQGRWAVAFTPLDGVDGLLVGSTFMDLLYTKFAYTIQENGGLTQGNMYLYVKSTGTGPAALNCAPRPESAAARNQAR